MVYCPLVLGLLSLVLLDLGRCCGGGLMSCMDVWSRRATGREGTKGLAKVVCYIQAGFDEFVWKKPVCER